MASLERRCSRWAQRRAVDARARRPATASKRVPRPGRRPARRGHRRRRPRTGWWRTTGRPRLALVVPSRGSRTTTTSRSPSRTPDSSLSDAEAGPVEHRERGARRRPGRCGTGPGGCPPSPQSARPSSAARTAVAASWSTSSSSSSSIAGAPYGPDRRVGRPAGRGRLGAVAVIDVAGFVADLKDHAVDHGFHVHDERHFVETYSLRQAWEVDLHPEEACGGPLDLHLVARGRPPDAAVVRGPHRGAARGRGPARQLPLPAAVHLVAAAAARRPRPARCWPRSWPASAAPTCRSRCRPSTRTRRPPTRPSAASPSSPTSRCRWPGSSAARSSSATSSTAAPTSATTCSTGPRPGSARTSSVAPMCTVLLRLSPGVALPVLLGAVRDEFVERPWDPPARHWNGPRPA